MYFQSLKKRSRLWNLSVPKATDLCIPQRLQCFWRRLRIIESRLVRENFSSSRNNLWRRENFGKDRSRRRDPNLPRIVEFGAILAIFSRAKFCWSATSRQKIREKFTRHLLTNSAKRSRIYIETLYGTNFPRDVCLNSSKSGGYKFRGSLVAQT